MSARMYDQETTTERVSSTLRQAVHSRRSRLELQSTRRAPGRMYLPTDTPYRFTTLARPMVLQPAMQQPVHTRDSYQVSIHFVPHLATSHHADQIATPGEVAQEPVSRLKEDLIRTSRNKLCGNLVTLKLPAQMEAITLNADRLRVSHMIGARQKLPTWFGPHESGATHHAPLVREIPKPLEADETVTA